MRAIIELENLGYSFALQGDKLHYEFAGATPPAEAYTFLTELRENKQQAIAYLAQRWVDPWITNYVTLNPPPSWERGFVLYRDGEPVTFYSLEELKAVTP